jgi:hypothetical protein
MGDLGIEERMTLEQYSSIIKVLGGYLHKR